MMITGLAGTKTNPYPASVLVLLIAWLGACAAAEIMVLTDFERFQELVSVLGVRRDPSVFERFAVSYALGPWLLAAVPLLLLWLDVETRARRQHHLIRFCLLDRRGPADASRWARRIGIGLTFLALPALLALHFGRHRLGLLFLISEDGPLEMATTALLLGSAVLVAVTARRWIGAGESIFGRAGVLLVLALTFALLALEEISWGQRIFGWQATGIFDANVQRETNLHNMVEKSPLLYVLGSALLLFAIASRTVQGLVGKPHRCRSWAFLLPDRAFLFFWAGVFAVSFEPLFDELIEEAFALFAIAYAVQLLESRVT